MGRRKAGKSKRGGLCLDEETKGGVSTGGTGQARVVVELVTN